MKLTDQIMIRESRKGFLSKVGRAKGGKGKKFEEI